MDSKGRPVLDHVQNFASYLHNYNAHLIRLWFDARNSMIGLVTGTIALGLFTSTAVAVLYIVISRKWRDGMAALILVSVLPDCLTMFSIWLGRISRLGQVYALMHANILDTGDVVAKISACIRSPQCDDTCTNNVDNKPEYASHGCVGTALMAADPMMHAAMTCLATAAFLLGRKRLGWATGSLLFVPLLAACVTAVMHVRHVCLTPLVMRSRHVRLYTKWEELNPAMGLDATTARLAQLSSAVPLLVVIYQYLWGPRGVPQLNICDSPTRHRWISWLAVTYVLPVCVDVGWRALHIAYGAGPHMSVLRYTFSAGEALLVPFMAIYPGLALLVQRMWSDSDAESEVRPHPEKSDAPASAGDF